jgi:hypothetical protein
LTQNQLVLCEWQPIVCRDLPIEQHWQCLPGRLAQFMDNVRKAIRSTIPKFTVLMCGMNHQLTLLVYGIALLAS